MHSGRKVLCCSVNLTLGLLIMISRVIAVSLALGLSSSALASEPACARKVAEIEVQIKHAKEAGNRDRVMGLERAMSSVQDHCTDAGLISEKEKEITKKQSDIDDILEEAREKESEGRLDKVEKLERKLAHERKELEVLRQDLADIKSLAGSN